MPGEIIKVDMLFVGLHGGTKLVKDIGIRGGRL
jgi:hypothetical protein